MKIGPTQDGRVYFANVADVVHNHCTARRVRRRVRDRDALRALRVATAMPLRVLWVEVPLKEIGRRLESDPTTGRRDDLQVAARWLGGSVGVGIEDLMIANEDPIQDVAMQIIGLGWTMTQ